jgi:electron transfer flavoprotein beta subunit
MSLSICVCIKQVPDPAHFDKISIDPKSGVLARSAIPAITNPMDRHAVEEALRIKEQRGATVTVITMGPPQARKSIEEALAMGADKGVLLCDAAFGGADTLATARVLSAGIRSLGGFDLVLCGNESADGATGQVPTQLAVFLGMPWATNVRRIDIENDKAVRVERGIESGYLRIMLALPAVVSVNKLINAFRLPTVIGIIEAGRKGILEIGCTACEQAGVCLDEIGSAGSPTKVIGIYESPHRKRAEMIEGDPQEVARRLVRKLQEAGAI